MVLTSIRSVATAVVSVVGRYTSREYFLTFDSLIHVQFLMKSIWCVSDQGSALSCAISNCVNCLKEFSSTLLFVVDGQCHKVQLNNEHFSSGTYFSITINRTAANVTILKNNFKYDILQVVGGTSFSSVCLCSATTLLLDIIVKVRENRKSSFRQVAPTTQESQSVVFTTANSHAYSIPLWATLSLPSYSGGVDAFTLYFDLVGSGLWPYQFLHSSTVSPTFGGNDCVGDTPFEEGSCPSPRISKDKHYFTISSCRSPLVT